MQNLIRLAVTLLALPVVAAIEPDPILSSYVVKTTNPKAFREIASRYEIHERRHDGFEVSSSQRQD